MTRTMCLHSRGVFIVLRDGHLVKARRDSCVTAAARYQTIHTKRPLGRLPFWQVLIGCSQINHVRILLVANVHPNTVIAS